MFGLGPEDLRGAWSAGLRRPLGGAFRPEWKRLSQIGSVRRGQLGTRLGRPLSLAVFETIALPIHFQNVDMMREPVPSSAPVSLSDPNASVHSLNGRLLVTRVALRS